MSQAQPVPANQAINRIKLLALIAAFAGPLLLATIWFALTDPNEVQIRSNGELISPAVPLTAFTLRDDEGQPFTLDSLHGHWTMVYFAPERCDEACRQQVYYMRQVRTSLHKEMHRVSRLMLSPKPSGLDNAWREEYPEMVVLSGDELAALAAQFEAAQTSMSVLDGAIYLVDPLGNLMMRFPPDLDPSLMLKDIKHLLRVSRIG